MQVFTGCKSHSQYILRWRSWGLERSINFSGPPAPKWKGWDSNSDLPHSIAFTIFHHPTTLLISFIVLLAISKILKFMLSSPLCVFFQPLPYSLFYIDIECWSGSHHFLFLNHAALILDLAFVFWEFTKNDSVTSF